MAEMSRRDVFKTGVAAAAGAGEPSIAAAASTSGPDPYSRIGVRPFINCTATYTINGGSQMLPEVIATIEQASHYHVNLDELMEKVGDRLAELLEVPWGIVTAGTAAALTHATSGCIAGTDPEKMQQLPNLTGLKNEIIMPRESRVVYDHALRTVGATIIEVNSVEQFQNAINPRTAMVEVLGNHFGTAKLDLKDVAPIARKAGIPILVDAAADYLIVPNPYLALGADLVAYSGGKIIRGPQTAGLLIGRKDLVRAAWANSAPHHGFGRAMKVSKEEIVGMLRAVEVWRGCRDVQADFREWENWYAYITEQVTRVPGVKTEVRGPARGGPFPTLNVSWDQAKLGITAGEVGRKMLDGEPRIMTHAEGEGHSFLIRPVALRPGDYKIVARRLTEVLRAAPAGPVAKRKPAAPSFDIAGNWEAEIEYEVGSARHQLALTTNGNAVSGQHKGSRFDGKLAGTIDGSHVEFRSKLPAYGTELTYRFTGVAEGDHMSGEVALGEYGRARWHAKRLA